VSVTIESSAVEASGAVDAVDAAPSACELLHEAVYSSMGDALRGAWDARFAEMVEYYEAHGRVPPQSMSGVGKWAHTQRLTRATMSAERKARLEALSWWSWSPLTDGWEARFAEMVAYYTEHGRVPPQSSGAAGRWASMQRQTRATMSTERKAKLEALPWWSWVSTASSDGWEARFEEMVEYYEAHGRAPPQSSGGAGRWVHTQRVYRGTMPVERKAKLEALPWWSWGSTAASGDGVASRRGSSVAGAAAESAWEVRLAEMVGYYEAHGRVPPQSSGSSGIWARKQRARRDTMSAERKAKLEALPWWSWSRYTDEWETKLSVVVAYYEEHGRVPPPSTPGGSWVRKQRVRRGLLADERKARLEEMPWWHAAPSGGSDSAGSDSPDRLD
jgi:hypothetical protein